MARKPLGATPRNAFIRVRTTKAGKEQAEEAAAKNGENVSDYVRRLIRQDIEKGARRG